MIFKSDSWHTQCNPCCMQSCIQCCMQRIISILIMSIQYMSNSSTHPFGYATDQVGRTISDEILFGVIAPGTHLNEKDLASRFSVSRTPIREALRQIVASGLAERRPHQGVYVMATPVNRLAEMFELSADIEGNCARHAAERMSKHEQEEFMLLFESGKHLAEEDAFVEYEKLNIELHEYICNGSHNSYLVDASRIARSRIIPYRRAQLRTVKRISQSHAEHTEIVHAIVERKGGVAEELMREHLTASYQASLEILEKMSGGM